MEKRNQTTVVVTSISSPSEILGMISKMADNNDAQFLLIGDQKSPAGFSLEGSRFLSLEDQLDLPFRLAKECPVGHYSRKNIGYLEAIKSGSNQIWETDDDNIPYPDFEFQKSSMIESDFVQKPGWNNVYQYFSEDRIWPRGLPLQSIGDVSEDPKIRCERYSPIQQGLADDNPDVDAVFRLTYDLPRKFSEREVPVALGKGVWCPFNSQNTTWFQSAFPLMYLPSHCSFRMTDIWRSFVAQRILWEFDGCVSFHSANVYQERNDHDLIKDFEDEIPGYLGNHIIREKLGSLDLKSGKDSIMENQLICYEALVKFGFVTENELKLVEAWNADISEMITF